MPTDLGYISNFTLCFSPVVLRLSAPLTRLIFYFTFYTMFFFIFVFRSGSADLGFILFYILHYVFFLVGLRLSAPLTWVLFYFIFDTMFFLVVLKSSAPLTRVLE